MSDASSKDKLQKWAPARGLLALAVVVVGYFASSIVGGVIQLIVYVLLGQPAGFGDSVEGQFVYFVATYGFFLAWVVWFFRLWGVTRQAAGLVRPNWIDPFYALAALPIYYISFALVITLVSALVPGFDAEQSQSIGFSGAAGSELIFVFLSLVVIPPVVEEVITRGYLYSGLKRVWPKYLAVIGTSLLFAAGHLEWGGDGPLVWVAGVFTLVLSVMLIALREITGRIWAPIFLHALVNGISFFALFVFT